MRAWLAYKLKTSPLRIAADGIALFAFSRSTHMGTYGGAIPLLISASMTYSTKPTVVKVYISSLRLCEGKNASSEAYLGLTVRPITLLIVEFYICRKIQMVRVTWNDRGKLLRSIAII